MGVPDPRVAERFWRKVQKSDGCWTWTGGNVRGYGRFQWGDRHLYAHRISYELCVGPIPDGLQIDHLCRNPSCVRPDHLEPVTQDENSYRGANRKLSKEDVEYIRTSGETTATLRAGFGVSKTHIDHIKAGKRRKVA